MEAVSILGSLFLPSLPACRPKQAPASAPPQGDGLRGQGLPGGIGP